MRGKVLDRMTKVECKGITPAYAGKSLSFFSFLSFFKDHPRLCGEKLLLKLWEFQHTGSPPPMRGKEKISHRTLGSTGITPAYAGKRSVEMRW